MKSYLNIVLNVIFLMACSTALSCGHQPSYQVSLYFHLHPQTPPIHVCNGAIVQSRLILTTASCLYYKISPNSPAVSLQSSLISVISGSSTQYHEELMLHVADIFIADKFNYTTGANDLALLRLNGILPLDMRSDMSWITLEDDKEYDDPCLANFFERNSAPGTPNYIQSVQMSVQDADSCKLASENFNMRKNDICSLYYIPPDLNCNAIETLQNYNDDRGTGLICGNKLVGLLSTILPWQNTSDCKDRPLKAYYAAVVPHINWIFDIIRKEDIKMYGEGDYIFSSPYGGETNAFIKPQLSENSTISSGQHNSANALERINCQLLWVILGIIYVATYLY